MQDKSGKKLSSSEVLEKSTFRMQTILQEFVVYLLHVVGSLPSHHIRRFFYRLSGLKIGNGSSIHMGARFYQPSGIVVGKDSIIGEGAVLDGRARLMIGDHVDIASDVMIYTSQHDMHSNAFAEVESVVSKEVVIEDYVFIGPRAIILPGVTLRKGSVVGAGAVVTKDVDSYMIVGGVPAKVIGERQEKNLTYRLGRAAWFR